MDHTEEAGKKPGLLRSRRKSIAVKTDIKAGAHRHRFRSRDRKYKEKSGCVTMTVYSSNGGDD